jgi:alkanesulfonate monooxygenase SsuD/methylene tetrahydromethanopterin reductase-like flavin-dependent oxidoreductase (luciferase family)
VGAGWNRVELEAMGGRYGERGSVLEEQLDVLRRLWTEDVVEIEGRYHTLVGVGIAPLPVQRPIPVWIGSGSGHRATRRVGAIADGWIPQAVPGRGLEEGLQRVRAAAVEAGREPDALGVQGVVQAGHGDLRRVERHLRSWRLAGASHVALDVRWSRDNDPAGALRRTLPAIQVAL